MRLILCALVVLLTWSVKSATAQKLFPFVNHEEQTLRIRDPSEMRRLPIPNTPPPETVSSRLEGAPARELPLDEAIRTALANSEVVRVLTGVSAESSGRTIYDPAIQSSSVDEARAAFDPTFRANNNFARNDQPGDSNNAGTAVIGNRRDSHAFELNVAKKTVTGGTLTLRSTPLRRRGPQAPFSINSPMRLNPRTDSSTSLQFEQPLLRGRGKAVNLAPIVLARIETERSFFQLKSSVQDQVRSVIEGYWNLVSARTDVWARRQQEKQSKGALDLAEARMRAGLVDIADVAQARLAYHNFRASLITAQSTQLQREAALRNVLGFPPYDPERIVPVTPPEQERVEPDWREVLTLAQERRPDLIELKLILEADEQRLLQANNQALPQLNAVGFYGWNGLKGTLPLGGRLSSGPGQFNDWRFEVNFEVPFGLRQARAGLREQELVIARDLANLQQGVHATSHRIAANLRNLAQFYAQYEAFHDAREAADLNLRVQYAEYRNGRTILLNLLQAINSWGDAVSAEAGALLQYNSELANLEQQTGTILETHGVRFFEERFAAISPLGRLSPRHLYPGSTPPELNFDRYPGGDQPSESVFELETPEFPRRQRPSTRREPLPPPEGG